MSEVVIESRRSMNRHLPTGRDLSSRTREERLEFCSGQCRGTLRVPMSCAVSTEVFCWDCWERAEGIARAQAKALAKGDAKRLR